MATKSNSARSIRSTLSAKLNMFNCRSTLLPATKSNASSYIESSLCVLGFSLRVALNLRTTSQQKSMFQLLDPALARLYSTTAATAIGYTRFTFRSSRRLAETHIITEICDFKSCNTSSIERGFCMPTLHIHDILTADSLCGRYTLVHRTVV